MFDYAKLVKAPRIANDEQGCDDCGVPEDLCPVQSDCVFKLAADAIEELSAKYQKALADLVKQAGDSSGKDANVPAKWVSVEDRLPDDWKQKIVFHRGGVSFAYYIGSTWCSSIGKSHYLKTVTHWMPMPEPPKEESCL